MTVAIKERSFATNREKAAFMLDQSIADAQLPAVRHWASVFRKLPVNERPGAIFRFVQWAIDYVRDPGQEVLEDAATVLLRGYGDCDAKSRTFVALCVASGILHEVCPCASTMDFRISWPRCTSVIVG
jgi:hypothetical protein